MTPAQLVVNLKIYYVLAIFTDNQVLMTQYPFF